MSSPPKNDGDPNVFKSTDGKVPSKDESSKSTTNGVETPSTSSAEVSSPQSNGVQQRKADDLDESEAMPEEIAIVQNQNVQEEPANNDVPEAIAIDNVQRVAALQAAGPACGPEDNIR